MSSDKSFPFTSGSDKWRGITFLVGVLSLLFCWSPCAVAVPAVPANCTVTSSKLSTDTTGFLVNWTIGAGDQTGVEIWVSVNANGVGGYQLVYDELQTSTSASIYLIASVMPPGTRVWFDMRTYSGTQTSKTFSGWSPYFFTDVPSPNTWNAPSGVTATIQTGIPRISWVDNSVLEDVFEIEARDTTVGGSVFQLVAQVGFNRTQVDIADYFLAGRTYEFRMRGRRWMGNYRTSATDYTPYSSTVSVSMSGSIVSGPAAPSNPSIAVSRLSSNFYGYKVNWVDNASNETGFEIWMPDSTATSGCTLVEEVGANATYGHVYLNAVAGVPFGFPIGAIVHFYVRSFSGTTTRTYSDWSTVASVIVPGTANWNAPTSAAVSFPSGIPRLTWVDNSDFEEIFELEGRDTTVGGSSFQVVGQVNFNLTQLDLAPYFQSGKSYELRLRARRWNGSYGTTADYTGYTSTVTFTMPGTVAGPPASPINLAVAASPSGANFVYNLSWDDKSTDETGFEIQEKGSLESTWRALQTVAGDTPGTPIGIGVGYVGHFNNAGTVVAFAANDLFDFQVRAVRGVGPFRVVSDNFATVLSTKQASFDPPSNVRITAPADNGLIQLFWSDNCTTEEGFEIEASKAGGAYEVLGTLSQTDYARYQSGGGVGIFPPSTEIKFRLRAFKGGASRIYTSYSNEGTVTTPAMTPPTNLQQGAASSDGVLNLTWADNSQNDAGYGVEVRKTLPLPADAAFGSPVLFTNPSATTAALNTQHVIPGYTYEFRVKAANQVTTTSPIIYSAPSNVVTLTVPSIAAPSNLRVQGGSLTETAVTLNWNDNSTIEGGFNIYSRPAGSSSAPTLIGKRNANVLTATMTLVPGSSVEFFVEAFIGLNPSGEVVSAMSSGLTVTARDAMTSPIYIEIRKDEAMTAYNLTTTTVSAMQTRSISGLPSGLTFDSGTGVLSGTPTGTGVTKCPVVITFADGWTHNNTLAIRILQAPVASSIPAQNLTIGTPESVPLGDKFSDPDASSAVRVNTNLSANGGNMDFILFDAATPLHVTNFMGYVNRGDYVNTVFHRSIAGFISQAGAFRGVPGSPTAFTAVPTQAQVTNEPGISNIRGTVALAKLDNQPSSGTNQFFVNLANNGPNLDFQNGGFTAFGRVTAPGMVVADQLAGLPTNTYSVTVGGSASQFADFPVNAASAPVTMDNALAVKINSVVALPVLTYSFVSNSSPSVVTASVVSGSLSLTPLSPGASSVVVRATDLEGRSVDQTVNVTVATTFANWSSTQGLPVGQSGPGDDADGDGDTNLEEFAFLTGPMASDQFTNLSPGIQADGPDNKGRITFKVRKFTNLTYTVETSPDLSALSWTPIWTTAQGFGAANVVSAVDNADHTLLTVKDTVVIAPAAPRFLRVKINSPP